MGAPLTATSVAGYNANPPSDDGAQTAANRVEWAKEKSKLTDPIKTAFDSSETATVAAFAKVIGGGGLTTTAISAAVGAADQGKLYRGTASSITITTPDATVVGSPFVFGLANGSAGDITLDGSGTQTVDGSLTVTVPAGEGYLVFTDGTNWFTIGRKSSSLPRSYLAGLTLTNGTDTVNDIDIAAGTCRDSTNVDDMVLAATLTKQLDSAWAVGTNAGGRDTGSIADGTWHIWLIKRSDTGVVDALFSTSASAPTMPTNYDRKRRIGSIVRSTSIRAFIQDGDYFHLVTPLLAYSVATPGTSAVTVDLNSAAVGGVGNTIPTGIRIRAKVTGYINNGGSIGYFSSLDQTDQAPSISAIPFFNVGDGTAGATAGTVDVWTNTSGQIRWRGANQQTYIAVHAWMDRRGRDS